MNKSFASRTRRWTTALTDDVIRFLLEDAATFVTASGAIIFLAFTAANLPLHVHQDVQHWRLFTGAMILVAAGALLASWPWNTRLTNRNLFVLITNAVTITTSISCLNYTLGGWPKAAGGMAVMAICFLLLGIRRGSKR